jgi:hypothetical protein
MIHLDNYMKVATMPHATWIIYSLKNTFLCNQEHILS